MSNSNIIFTKPFCEISFNRENQVLTAKWSGFLTLQDTKAGCSAMTDYIKKNNVKFHLSNHIDLKVLSKEVQSYLTQEWFPEVEAVGLRKVAALVSENVFAKATVDKVNKEAKVGNLTIGTFNSEHDCMKWFEKVLA